MNKLKLYLITIFFLAGLPAFAQNATQCLVSGVWTPCSMAPQPSFAQTPVSAKSTGSVASINAAYGSNTVIGNTLVVVFANGNNSNPTAPITDTLSLTWFKAVQVANSTTFESEIWYAPNSVGGADTVTVTPGGSNASIAMTIYEVPGLVYPSINKSPLGPQALDQTTSGTVTSGTSPSVSITPIVPNEYVFVGFALGNAAQTITVVSPYNNDSGQQNPTTPAGLFSFVSASLYKSEMVTTSPSATATSEPWAVAVASFKTLSVPIQGTVQGMGIAGTPSGGVFSVQGVSGGQALPVSQSSVPWQANSIPSTSSTYAFAAAPYYTNATSTSTFTNIKSSAGNVYGFDVVNPNASTCWIQFYNATSPTVGSSIIYATPILASAGGFKTLPFPVNFSTAISIATTTTATGSTECSTGMGLTLYYQ